MKAKNRKAAKPVLISYSETDQSYSFNIFSFQLGIQGKMLPMSLKNKGNNRILDFQLPRSYPPTFPIKMSKIQIYSTLNQLQRIIVSRSTKTVIKNSFINKNKNKTVHAQVSRERQKIVQWAVRFLKCTATSPSTISSWFRFSFDLRPLIILMVYFHIFKLR